jgi:hypothetical protein
LTMAIQIAPPEPDLSRIRKPGRFWRVLGWGSAATIALAAAALASQTEAGGQRLQLAIGYLSDPMHVVADLSEPTPAVAPIPPRTAENQVENKAETQRLAAQVRDLAADRERLTARITMLERSLDDMTGSIKQQSEQQAKINAAVTPPAPSAPATMATALPPLVPLAMPAIQPAAKPENPPPKLEETKTETVPVPPVRVAAAPAKETAAEPTPPAKNEFGIDLGGAATIDALRMHWATMKANYGPLLVGLHPLAAQHTKQPSGVDYRLVAGPLLNTAEAAKLCVRFPITRTGCRPAKFDGAQLAEH